MIESLADRWPEIAVAVLAVACLALIGGLATDIGPWYKGLKFPRLKPPDYLFGPGWTVIYIFIAASGVVAWDAAGAEDRTMMVLLFAINGALNAFWSPLFFKLKRPDWALYEWVPFWLSIVALVVFQFRISTLAGWLIVPYLAWVTYAGWLNWRVVVLNRPFASPSDVAPPSRK
jgi:translocator protein